MSLLPSAVRSGARALATAAPATFGAPAPSFLASLFGGAPALGPPLTEPLAMPTGGPPPKAGPPPATVLSALPNGARVAAEDTPVSVQRREGVGRRLGLVEGGAAGAGARAGAAAARPSRPPPAPPSLSQGATATLGIYVESGSVHETAETTGAWKEGKEGARARRGARPRADALLLPTGASHLLEYLAFKSTAHRTHFRLVRELEAMGGHVSASASREQAAYSVDVPKTLVPAALEVLCDAVLNPKFSAADVKAATARLTADAAALKDNPQAFLLESLHEVAFTGGLARPLVAPPGAAARLTPATLADFHATTHTGPRVVLAGSGVSHADLAGLAGPMLATAGSAAGPPAPASSYAGGDARAHAGDGATHVALAFECAGGWRDVDASVAATVIQFLLGGGGSFSAGGPGKGMHSRLYTRVLARHPWMRTCTAFSSLYNDTGLVGVYAAADAAKSGEVAAVVAEEIAALASAVPAGELERAKAAAVSSVLMNLESRAVVAEDAGRQVLTYGHRKPVADFVAAIDALTPAKIAAFVKKATSTPLAMAVLGDVAAVPRYSAVQAMFK